MNINIFCATVSEKIKRPLNYKEKDIIKTYLSQIKIDARTSLKLAFKYHLEQVCRELSKYKYNEEENNNLRDNTREQQIKMLGKTEEDFQDTTKKHNPYNQQVETTSEIAKLEALFLLEVSDVYDLAKAVAPRSRLKYNYLLLDSGMCSSISATCDSFSWLIQDENIQLRPGYINLHSKMRNIVMARLGRVTFAHMYEDFTQDVVARHRYAFGFDEFASQALITPNGTKFQFITFMADGERNLGTTTVLSPFNANRGWFRFREKFKMLDKLTLTITNLNRQSKVILPADPLSFPAIHYQDRELSLINVSPIQGPIYINNSQIRLPLNYPYVDNTGSVIFNDPTSREQFLVSGYNSGDSGVDAIWNGLNTIIKFADLTANVIDFYLPFTTTTLPLNAFTMDEPYIEIPFTITSLYKPRFIGVLELLCEDDSDEYI